MNFYKHTIQIVSPQRHTSPSLEAHPHIPSEIYFSNLLDSAAKPDQSETPRGTSQKVSTPIRRGGNLRARARALEPHSKAFSFASEQNETTSCQTFHLWSQSGTGGEDVNTRIWSGNNTPGGLGSRRLSPLLRSTLSGWGDGNTPWPAFLFGFCFILLSEWPGCSATRTGCRSSCQIFCACAFPGMSEATAASASTQKYTVKGRGHTHTQSTHTYLQKPVKSLLQSFLLPSKNCVKFTTL